MMFSSAAAVAELAADYAADDFMLDTIFAGFDAYDAMLY